MAKYTMIMSCGHEDVVMLDGKTSDRERKIEYLKECGLCKECYKKKKEAEVAAQPLSLHASIMPYIDEKDGSILLTLWFEGNTKPIKDDIKALGYRWGERESADDCFSIKRTPLVWSKLVKKDELKAEVKKAVGIGAKSFITNKSLFEDVYFQIALDKNKEWQERQDKIVSLKKPDRPELIKHKYWNEKIYGKSGSRTVYLDNVKVDITDEQSDELIEYVKKMDSYRKQVETIKRG